nr:MAG TPA: glutaredoxin [Caudoviricetes sp.]
MNIILYTIDCPNCIILEKKLRQKNVEFLKVSDKDTIIAKGFGGSTFPILEVDGVVMNYKTAIQWVNNQ